MGYRIIKIDLPMKTITAISFLFLFSFNAFSQVPAYIQAAISDKTRPEAHKLRDKNRRPSEIIQLSGIQQGMKVIDLFSGRGYYTEILSRIVGDKGLVIAHNPPYVLNRFPDFMLNEENGWLSNFKTVQWMKNVKKSTDELDQLKLPLKLDAALMILTYHDLVWQNVDRERMNQHIFNSLKKGGTYIIVDHQSQKGRGDKDVKTLHRIEKQYVIDEVLKAGFKLMTDSPLLRNKEDRHNYSVFRDFKNNRDKTDRFVLKFVKPD